MVIMFYLPNIYSEQVMPGTVLSTLKTTGKM